MVDKSCVAMVVLRHGKANTKERRMMMSNARYFYWITPKVFNDDKKRHKQDGNTCNVWIILGHYGKTIESLQESKRLLDDKLKNIKYKYFDLTEEVSANVEIGASSWDKYVLRIYMKFKIIEPTTNKGLIEQLESNGFYLVHDDFERY